MLGDPSRDTFSYMEADLADFSVVGQLRCAEHDVSGLVVRQIDQTSVAGGNFDGKGDEFLQHIADGEAGADNPACTMQDGNLPCGRVVL